MYESGIDRIKKHERKGKSDRTDKWVECTDIINIFESELNVTENDDDDDDEEKEEERRFMISIYFCAILE